MLKKFLIMAITATALLGCATKTEKDVPVNENPLLNYAHWTTPHGTYPFNEIKAEHYMPAFEQAFQEGLAEIDAIVRNPEKPTFENTIVAFERSGHTLSMAAYCFFNLTSAETNDVLDSIETELMPKYTEYETAITLNDSLFQRIKVVYDQRESLRLKPEQRKLLEDTYEGFANNGANLDSVGKAKYKELSTRLSMLTLAYGQNVLKATNAWTKLITDESQLTGLNADTKAMMRANAERKGKKGWLMDLKPTTTIPFMQDCANRELRKELYMALNTRCIGGEFDNTQNIIDIANTRLELAQLFDKEDFAQKALYKRCAENEENVMRFLNQLRDAYMPAARQEVAELQAFADSLGLNDQLQPWDFSYYSKKLKDAKYSISDDVLRPYFELESVKQGVFGLANRLYGLTFVKDTNIQVYHPEVSAYDVYDADGQFLAVYYSDFHPRDGKRGGAWMNEFQGQYQYPIVNRKSVNRTSIVNRTFVNRKSIDHRPHITNVMNFTRPVPATDDTEGKPALLTYDEVETFLHEFGHALHGMLTRCTYGSQSGTNVPRDFVELPSQFNENFLGEKEFLDTFAKHYETGEAMPQDLIDKIKAADNYHAAYACVRQLSFGYLDMAWHMLREPFAPAEGQSVQDAVIAFGNNAMEQVRVMPNVPGTQMETAFTHIFSGGYAAGYYSYKWAELLDADAFAQFQNARDKRGSIFDKKTADSFRKNILERGSTEEPMVLYRRFRGGDPTIDALLQRDGIKK